MILLKKVLFIPLIAFVMWGCAKKQIIKPTDADFSATPVISGQDIEEAQVRFTDWQSVPQLKSVYFDLDKSELREDDRNKLKSNAEYLKNNPELTIIVEGHCDERGTTEYNLSLGQRRAASVRTYYGRLGVELGNIGTISYGEESPDDLGHNEKAWAQNRRVVTKVRTK